MSHVVYLSLGSNLGDRKNNLENALEALVDHAVPHAVSPIYETEPWGSTDQPEFYNICAIVTTDEQPSELLAHIKEVEDRLGRRPTHRWGPRLIDIDILFFDHLVLDAENLQIPHPRISERAFVLVPLADLIPKYRHPVSSDTVDSLLKVVDTDGIQQVDSILLPPVDWNAGRV